MGRLRAMKYGSVLRGVAHETRVCVIAPCTVIGILVPLVAVFVERLRTTSLGITWTGTTAILGPSGSCLHRRRVEMVGLQIIERCMIVVSRLATRDDATKLVIELKNSRGGKSDCFLG